MTARGLIQDDRPIRRVVDLLALVRQGGVFVQRQTWELNEDNQWRQFEVQLGERCYAVDPPIAIVALRRGLVT